MATAEDRASSTVLPVTTEEGPKRPWRECLPPKCVYNRSNGYAYLESVFVGSNQ